MTTIGVAGSAQAAQITWTGAGTDNNWSTIENWSGAGPGSPAGDDITFTNDDRTVSATVNNSIDADTTISSLSYSHTAATPETASQTWHVTEIASDATLTLNGSGTPPVGLGNLSGGGVDLTSGRVLTIGNHPSGANTTSVKMTGGGQLTISASTRDFLVTNSVGSGQANATLDMAGLSDFTATVNGFYVGRGPRTQSIVTLASAGSGTNTITATLISIADSNNHTENGGTSELRLGDSNTLYADTIFVGAPTATNLRNVQNGKISFQTSGLTNPTVTIRGTAGDTSRASMTIGSHGVRTSGTTNTLRSVNGNVDLTAGTVDALLGTVLLGEGQGAYNNQSGAVSGTLSMSAGSIDALAVILGRSNTGSSSNSLTGFATGTLNVNGGTFTTGTMQLATNLGGGQKAAGNLNIAGGAVSVTGGGITMGTRSGSAVAGTVVPSINLSSGSLIVAGDIAEGANGIDVASTVNLTGGTLDLAGNAVVVDTFAAENGTLRNLGQLNAGGTLTKTTADTLIVEGVNTYTGNTAIDAGTLLLNGTHALAGPGSVGAYTVAAAATLGGSGSTDAAVIVQEGAILAPGASIESLAVGSAQIGGTLTIEIDDLDPLQVDRLDVTGLLQLASTAQLQFVITGELTEDAYVFATYGSLEGAFLPVTTPEGYSIDYNYNDAKQIALVIPEPASLGVLMALGGWGLARRRRGSDRA